MTTTRSNVRKPDIPLVTDPVSKLQAVGKETVSKLRDMQAAAAASLNAEDPEVLEEFTCQTRCIVTGAPLAHAYDHNVMLHPRV